MALIRCIECGKEISSRAPACPHCGCPSEYQTTQNQESDTAQHSGDRLKNQEFWNRMYDLCAKGDGLSAMVELKKTMKIMPSESNDVINVMREGKGLPIDLIIEKFPDQAADYQEPVIPTTKPCSACGKTISVKAEVCPHCGQRTGVIVCPKCGETEIWFLNSAYKVASMALLGPFSVNTVRNKYQCAKCKHKF